MDSIERLIEDYIAEEFLQDRPRNALQGNLLDDGIIDSLGIMALITYIEKQFDAHILPEDVVVENFSSVAAIAQVVRQRLNA